MTLDLGIMAHGESDRGSADGADFPGRLRTPVQRCFHPLAGGARRAPVQPIIGSNGMFGRHDIQENSLP